MLKSVMFAAVFAVLVGSCQLIGNRPSDETVKNAVRMENALANSNTIAILQSQFIFSEFEDELHDYNKVYKAKIWYPKATMAYEVSEKAFNYLETIKADIVIEGKSTDSISLNSNRTIIQKYFFDKGKGEEVIGVVMKCRKELLNVDSNVFKEFQFTLVFDARLWNPEYSDKQLAQEYFSNLCVAEARALVTKFENDILNSRALIVRFLKLKSISNFCGYTDEYAVVSSVNARLLKPGQDLEITVGRGGFTKQGSPVVYIDGKELHVNYEGLVKYKIRVKKEGKFKENIVVKFIREDGKPDSVRKTIEYEVSSCAGVEKME